MNIVARSVNGTITVDGKDAVSFAESASAIYVRLQPPSTMHDDLKVSFEALSSKKLDGTRHQGPRDVIRKHPTDTYVMPL